jgi:hypothetical protein
MHALRLWGSSARFDSPDVQGDVPILNPFLTAIPSAREMVAAMLSNPEARRLGVYPNINIRRSEYGVAVEVGTVPGSIGHVDQYLKVAGDLGLSSGTQLELGDGETATISDVLRDSLAQFQIDQELDFTAASYAMWLPPHRSWHDRFGVEHSLEEVVGALLRRPVGSGACFGTHLPYALVQLYRSNEECYLFSRSLAGRIATTLSRVSRLLERHQSREGAWYAQWQESASADETEPAAFQAIAATGHHLEWISYAPPPLRPGEETIRRAARFLAESIPLNSVTTISRSYPRFSHAARALVLLEEVDPANLISNGQAVTGA